MKKNHQKKYTVAILSFSAGLFLYANQAGALPLTYGFEGIGKTVEVSFYHNNRDVWDYEKDQVNLQMGVEVEMDTPRATSKSNADYQDLYETGNFATPGAPQEPAARSTSTVNPAASGTFLSVDIGHGVSGESYHNVITEPARRDNPSPEPGVDDYYNNWEYHTANAFSYGGYENNFIVDDGDGVSGEKIYITGTYAYEYSLSGTWTSHLLEEPDGFTYTELTGFFWTAFQPYILIGDGFGTAIFSQNPGEIWTNRSGPGLLSDAQVFSFGFWAMEGETYDLLMWSHLGGHADGIAAFASTGASSLKLAAAPIPEPATLAALVAGLLLLALLGRWEWARKIKKA